ncbi:MAG: T9SS type A sorting domain-containing protein [Bacteroidales bacterium]|nr:T9SS type A sorting domain-containing protein [Bacteroidales bacterium]
MNDIICNPTGGEYCKVCVRVHNKSNYPSSGNEKLIVNWAKAGLGLSWNYGWIGDNSFFQNTPVSGYVTDTIIPIPVIPAGGDTVLRILWLAPDPADYANIVPANSNEELWHFCLAARVHDGTPIFGEYSRFLNMKTFTTSNDNVAWKNISIISDNCNGACISVSNPNATIDQMTTKMDLVEAGDGNTPSITDYAEVYITFDAGLLAAINSNANITGLDWVNSNTLRWNGGSACIPVTLPANSYYTLQTTIHFLADQIPATNNFDFDIVLRNATGDSILGGEHYKCVRTNGRYFQAVAHDNMTILWGETASLYATDILETAEYNWYDEQGNEVGDGLTCNVNPQQNSTYTLRVTADADGYRAYSTVTVMVVDGELRLLAPNPADNQVRIGYALSRNVSSATLQILNGSGQVIYSQSLSGGSGSKVTGETLVNTSSLAAGSYTVRLISSRGNIFDSKTLIIQ